MLKSLGLIFLTLFLMNGCGLTKDQDVNNDDKINEDLQPIATNCADNVENAYGCYGPTKTFGVGALTIINGGWSIYAMSTLPVSTQSRYFDVYKYGYEFLDDGIVYKYDATGITGRNLNLKISTSCVVAASAEAEMKENNNGRKSFIYYY